MKIRQLDEQKRQQSSILRTLANASVFMLIVYTFFIQILWSHSIILYALVACTLLFCLVYNGNLHLMPATMLFIVITGAFGIFVTTNNSAFLNSLTNVIKAYVFMICIANVVLTPNGFHTVRVATIISGVCLSVMLTLAGSGIDVMSARLTVSESQNANLVSMTIVVAIFMCLFELCYESNFKKKFLLYGISIYMFVASMSTGTRKAFIAIFIALVLYFLFVYNTNGKKSFKKVFGFLIGIIVIAVATQYVLLNTSVLERFQNIGYEGDRLRALYYRYAWEMFIRKPIFGWGWGGFAQQVGMYSHSTYAELIANTGLVGFLTFFICWFILFFGLARKRKNARETISKKIYTLAIIEFLIIIGLATGTAIFYEMNLSLCMGVFYGLSKMKEKNT